jgi:predicted Ser/Thr protein kinase
MAEQSVGSPLSMHDPRTVGPWSVHSRLGAGGMGVVYFATSEGQQAAIKVIRPGLLDAPATRDRFRREVEILRAVRDVHICQFLDADLESEPAWLALEYLAGPVLRDQVAQNGPLADQDWWELARGLSQALAVLEVHRVTHRDLKPGNVILHARGPVLIDFGIAHPEDATALTATGLVTGSPAWLSPEQANLEPTGPATDIFTLGSLLAFSATGRPPFGEGASIAVLTAIATREPDLVGIDPVRADLLRRMLAKDPAVRPAAREILEVARAALAGGDVTTTGIMAQPLPSAPEPAPPQPDPHATLVADGPTTPGMPLSIMRPGEPAASPAPDASAPTPGALDATRVSAAGPAPVRAPAPPPPRPVAGARPVGPRTAAAQQRRAARRRVLLVLLAIATLVVAGWFLLTTLGSGEDGSPDQPGTSQPGSAGDAPPAPGSDQLRSGDWLLESYRLDNTDGGLVVSGTVRNRGAATASADLTVWVYLGDQSLGSVATTVSDVPAGAAVPVTMTGDAVWKPGQKVVLLEAS